MSAEAVPVQSAPLALQGQHTEGESDPWTINIPDHAKRRESRDFVSAKNLAHKILATLGLDGQFYGTAVIQMHHGGSLWLFDGAGWFMVQNQAGIEWSAQFCADPKKVEQLRLNAKRLYDGFPATLPEMARLGYQAGATILNTPIATAQDVARWVDSIFNSCVPLPAVRHTGVLPKGDGRHHYPTPITDIDLIKYDDFVLWVTDPVSGTTAAVVPSAARGKGVNKTRLVYATPGTQLDKQHTDARSAGKPVVFGASSPLTQQAYQFQQSS
ncbi:MAG: DUF6424 family protein [Streptosporangiaceae bacterium]